MAHRLKELSDQELALIVNRLQMPVIVRDYITHNTTVEDCEHYALHEIMSNLKPSMALLCAAITLQEIAQKHDRLTYLGEVCCALIKKYSATAKQESIKPDENSELYSLAGDLDQILALMEMCRLSFEIIHPEMLIFLNIMIPQIEAQVMIVEEAIRMQATEESQIRKPRQEKPRLELIKNSAA